MKSFQITGGAESLSVRNLEDFERSLGTNLPIDYRDFLLKHNGGFPSSANAFFPLDKESPLYESDPYVEAYFFHPISSEEESESLQSVFNSYKDRIPAEYLPIAYDSLGNVILIGLSPDVHGRMYFWDHEAEGEAIRLGDLSFPITPIAVSFKYFLDKLGPADT